MHFVALGLNVGSAPVAVRERLAFAADDLAAGLADLRARLSGDGMPVAEAVIVSTCHRLEVVALVRDVEEGERALIRFLAENRDVPERDFVSNLTRWRDQAAIEHVFALAAGLRSPVLGDSQILGQVSDAYHAAHQARTAGPVLATLFQYAVRGAKRVHSETTFNRHVSVGYTAAALALETVEHAGGRRALVIGAGKMGDWTTRYLHEHGMAHVLVANRRLAQAQTIAGRVGGVAVPWEELLEAVVCADVVISTTAAPHAILTRADIAAVMARRSDRSLHLIDIAVPRDIEAAVAEIPGVRLTTVDDLPQAIDPTRREREAEVPHAEAIIAAEFAAFRDWVHARAVVPTITELRMEAEQIRQTEVARFVAHDRTLTDEETARLDALTKAIVNKLLHHPTVRLKAQATSADGVRYAEVARDLFGLLDPMHAVNDDLLGVRAACPYVAAREPAVGDSTDENEESVA